MKKYVYLLTLGLITLSFKGFSQDLDQVKMQDTTVVKKIIPKEKITYGIQGGYNISSITNYHNNSFGDNTFSQKSKPGFNLGVFVEIPINPMWHIQPELNYSLEGFKANTDAGQFQRNYNFATLPILVKFYPVSHFYLFLGPQLSYNVETYDTWTVNDPDFSKYQRRNSEINKLYGGVTGGIGVDMSKHILLNIGYYSDLTKTYHTTGSDTPPIKNQVLNIRLGYRF